MTEKRQPDQELIFNLTKVVSEYDASAVARVLVLFAGGLIATGGNPESELIEVQKALARRVRETIEHMPEILEHLDVARSELGFMLRANKGLRRDQ